MTDNKKLLLEEISGAGKTLNYFATLKNYVCPERLREDPSQGQQTQIFV